MYILPQILSFETKNLIINQLVYKFKNKLSEYIDNISLSNYRYSDNILNFQELINTTCIDFLTTFFETIDLQFKNSPERKEKYYISKSNVNRTLFTIFGVLTFKRTHYINKLTGEYYFYVDDIMGIDSYKTYDSVVRAILVQDSTLTNPSHTSMFSSLNTLALKKHINYFQNIPKQTIYKIKQETKIRNIEYKEIPVVKTLYAMVDEKWIYKQDKDNPNKHKWIMSKCFVTFTHIKRKGKRSRLEGRHVFITSSDKPWKEFMNEIWKIYDFEQIETINLLSDAGSWILSGAHELKLYTNNKVKINTCEFHVKQKISRSTTDKNLRVEIANIIYELEDKAKFKKAMDKLIENAPKEERKKKITEYKNYILKHWKGIINMKNSLCKSSMESHIQHCIASAFSNVPKAYSSKNIETYLKLQELFLNGESIFDYYLKTYNSDDSFIYKKEEVDFSIFEKTSSSNIPTLSSKFPTSSALHGIAHP